MPPTPQSSFVCDTQAWTPMASQMPVMTVQHAASLMAAHYSDAMSVASDGDRPQLTRSRSSDVLGAVKMSPFSRQMLSREATSRRAPVVTATRSKSFSAGTFMSDAEEADVEEVPLDERWAKALRETKDAAAGAVVEDVEDVSLDEKWAEALRNISLRLASERSLDCDDAADFEPSNEEDASVNSSAEDRDDGEGKGGHEDENPHSSQLHNPSRLDIDELVKTIEQANKSAGKVHIGRDAVECGDEASQSSIARDVPRVTKGFAESKDYMQAPQDPSWGRRMEGTEVMLQHEDDYSVNSYHSSGSESSVTLSLASEYTMETYNSLTAPPPSRVDSLLPQTASKEAYDGSPTSVQNIRPYYRDEDDSRQQEEEEDGDFESSFTMAAKDHSETKTSMTMNARNLIGESDGGEAPTKQATSPVRTEPSSQSLRASRPIHYEQVIVEDVTSDSDDEEWPAAAPSQSKMVTSSKASPPKSQPSQSTRGRSKSQTPSSEGVASKHVSLHQGKAVEEPRRKSQPSFFSALVHNSRSRSKSRSRQRHGSRSKSRSRRCEEGAEEEEQTVTEPPPQSSPSKKSQPSFFSALVNNSRRRSSSRSQSRGRGNEEGGAGAMVGKRVAVHSGTAPRETEQEEKVKPVPEGSRESSSEAVHTDPYFPSRGRGPITHPHYKLGDPARDEDMIVIAKRKRKGRSRRRRRSSSSSDSEDEEAGHSLNVDVCVAIGQLRHLDAAWVRRSDGKWTYALVADGDDNQIRFVVNDRGSTKSVPRSLWKSCVRRIRVLTPRQGDRISLNPEARKKRTVGRAKSFRGKGKGRFVSPSPTRRNVGVLDVPPTIFEGREYHH